MNPVAFEIFGFTIKWYSIFILVGVIVAWIFLQGDAKRFDIKKDFITNLVFWTMIVGIIGARAYYVIFNWEYYASHTNEIWHIWEGGLAIHGGLLAGCLTIFIYCKRHNTSALRILDMASPYVLLAQAIGRWGNFFNGEAYGVATTYEHLKSLKIIPEFIISGMNINGIYYTPTFYFESLWCILGFIIILLLRKIKYLRLGQQIGTYLMWYSLGRFFIESLRTDSLMIFGYIKAAQVISIVLFIIGLVLVLLQARKPKLEMLYNKHDEIEVVKL